MRQARILEVRCVALVLGLVLLGAAFTKGDGSQSFASQKVHLELRLLVTGADSATFPSAGRVGDLAVGESEEWSLVVGLDRTPGAATACKYNVLMPAFPPPSVPEDAAHVWEARLTVRAASVGKIELEVDWKRIVRGIDTDRRVVMRDSRVVTLGEGQHMLLDFIAMRSVPAWQACYANLALQLEASITENPALADERIGYDLWLVDEGPGGPPTTRRWQMAGKQGEARDFDFEPLRLSVRDGGAGEHTPVRVNTRVFGQVRGRLQDDGSLEVALVAQREDSPEHRHWSIGGHGDKDVRVTAGETIRLELPAPDATPEGGRSEPERRTDPAILAGLRARTVSLVLTARPVE